MPTINVTDGLAADMPWDQLNELWDETPYYWNIVQIFLGGKNSQTDIDIYKQLTKEQKQKVVSLYVEIFKTHLSNEERFLLERAGIRQTYYDVKEVEEIVSVTLKDKNIERENMNELKTKTLHDLFKVLDLKIN
jgi:hypothetical protein